MSREKDKIAKMAAMRVAVRKAKGVKSRSDLPAQLIIMTATLRGREKIAIDWWLANGIQHLALAWFVYGGNPVWRALKDEEYEERTCTIPAFLYALERRCL